MGGDDRARYFVTGATGMLGQAVVRALAQSEPDARIRCLVRRQAVGAELAGTELIVGDLEDEDALRRGLAGAAMVLHFAGATHAKDSREYADVNGAGTARLVRLAEQAGVRRFIFASSRAIDPRCGPYAVSKQQAEAVIQASRLRYVILRFAEVYGGGSSEGVASLIRIVQRWPVIPAVRGAILAPLHVDDAVQAVLASMRSEHAQGRVYTIAGSRSYTFEECVQAIARVLGVHRICLPVPAALLRPAARLVGLGGRRRFVADQVDRLLCRKEDDIEPAMSELEFAPRGFEEGLRRVV